MAKETQWWTSPAEADNGLTIMVTGRKDIGKFRANPKFSIRVEITMPYKALPDGMPLAEEAELLESVTERLQNTFSNDSVAVLTGIFTGDCRRDWVFYTLSTHIFGRKINEALADLPILPLTIYCENDPDWNAYDEMAQTEINLD